MIQLGAFFFTMAMTYPILVAYAFVSGMLGGIDGYTPTFAAIVFDDDYNMGPLALLKWGAYNLSKLLFIFFGVGLPSAICWFMSCVFTLTLFINWAMGG